MNTCGGCKYKGEEIVTDDFRGDDITTGYFLCERAKHVGMNSDLKEFPKAKCAVIDGSGYYAALCVEDDFGCNQWEPKK